MSVLHVRASPGVILYGRGPVEVRVDFRSLSFDFAEEFGGGGCLAEPECCTRLFNQRRGPGQQIYQSVFLLTDACRVDCVRNAVLTILLSLLLRGSHSHTPERSTVMGFMFIEKVTQEPARNWNADIHLATARKDTNRAERWVLLSHRWPMKVL